MHWSSQHRAIVHRSIEIETIGTLLTADQTNPDHNLVNDQCTTTNTHYIW